MQSARARNSFSRRKCSSRDSGDRHMPARRWCSAAIVRYCVASTMTSSHACSFARIDRSEGRGTLKRVPQQVSNGKARTRCFGVSIASQSAPLPGRSRENPPSRPPGGRGLGHLSLLNKECCHLLNCPNLSGGVHSDSAEGGNRPLVVGTTSARPSGPHDPGRPLHYFCGCASAPWHRRSFRSRDLLDS